MSEDGGFEELPECLDSLATRASSSTIRLSCSVTRCSSSTIRRSLQSIDGILLFLAQKQKSNFRVKWGKPVNGYEFSNGRASHPAGRLNDDSIKRDRDHVKKNT